jgi:hypothetical protein
MCPYSILEAITLWGKACNFHKGTDPTHVCKNPPACQRTLDKAFSVELSSKGWE